MCGGDGEETKDECMASTTIFGHVTVWHNEWRKKQRKNKEKQDPRQKKWDSSYYN